MKTLRWISVLAFVCALYDGVLGALFLVAPDWPFRRFEVTPPNHYGYVVFPAALLLIFALMFLAVAVAPVRNRGLIVYGMLLKLVYVAVTVRYWLADDLPWIWQPFTVIDAVMLALLVWAYVVIPVAAATRGPRANA